MLWGLTGSDYLGVMVPSLYGHHDLDYTVLGEQCSLIMTNNNNNNNKNNRLREVQVEYLKYPFFI